MFLNISCGIVAVRAPMILCNRLCGPGGERDSGDTDVSAPISTSNGQTIDRAQDLDDFIARDIIHSTRHNTMRIRKTMGFLVKRWRPLSGLRVSGPRPLSIGLLSLILLCLRSGHYLTIWMETSAIRDLDTARVIRSPWGVAAFIALRCALPQPD